MNVYAPPSPSPTPTTGVSPTTTTTQVPPPGDDTLPVTGPGDVWGVLAGGLVLLLLGLVLVAIVTRHRRTREA
jgi:hypothetical protein